MNSDTPTPSATKEQLPVDGQTELWIPKPVSDCISTVSVNEGIKADDSVNPFYLRADFDGNSKPDYTIIVQGVVSKKYGVIVCRDGKIGSVFAALAGPTSPQSEIDENNFVTDQWEIETASEAAEVFVDPGKKVRTKAKGEAVVFVFEGGATIHLFATR